MEEGKGQDEEPEEKPGSRKAGCNGLETNVKGSRNPHTKEKERCGKAG